MYAVVKTGGKQYSVTEGMTLKVEKLAGEKGDALRLEEVLFIGGEKAPRIGAPRVDGAHIACEIVRQGKDRKVTVYKKKRRKGYEKKVGHRQPFTEIRVKKIHA